ncbi:MAG: saccharopine dehydrogenase C-terminal domain-containing protein [Vicinamibacteria bacterium]
MSESTRKVVVLGAGMVGQAIARDLADDAGLRVDVADVRAEALEQVARRADVGTVRADLANPDAVKRLVAAYELAVGALPSAIGLQTLRAVLEAGRHCVDISFMPEDALSLDALARAKGVTAVVDCGVAPGLSNMMCGAAAARLAPLEEVEIYVGGLPVERRWPFDYKAGFAPSDVLEEYTRPSRVVEHGRVVVKEPLSEPELLDFPGVGTLEAFNTDGLRSLVRTIDAPFMKEKTLRWPGHADLMRVLKDTGFFSLEPVDVGGQKVRPRDLTAALLFPKWTFDEGEPDLTVMRVRVAGHEKGSRVACSWDFVDRYHEASGLRSMSRSTGYVATSVARLVAAGAFRRPGVHAPETLGREPGLLDRVLADLAARGVRCRASVTPLA